MSKLFIRHRLRCAVAAAARQGTLLFPMFVLCGLLSAAVSTEAQGNARPEWVQEVADGKRTEARASWWGFDEKDSTAFLQSAINSKVKKLIIDRQASPWVTRPLTGVSDQEIILEEGTELVALKGAFQAKSDCLLGFQNCDNITIRGEKKGGTPARIRMHKVDYQSGAYEKSEWRHGLVICGCQNVLIQDLVIEKTGGDGIYLGATQKRNVNLNVVIRRVDCDGNHRQGISVISAENLLIEDCLLRNTDGTDPKSGIDFEPNSPGESLVNCVMRNCVSENNAGTGYAICSQYLNSGSRPMSIRLENCVSRNNKQHGIHLCSAPKDPPGGLLRITDFVSEKDGMAGLSVQFNPSDAARVELENVVIRDAALKDDFFPPLYVQGIGSETRPPGNIHFKNVTIQDDRDRPILRIRDGKENKWKDITGEIVLVRNGKKETIRIDDAWLDKMRQASAPQKPAEAAKAQAAIPPMVISKGKEACRYQAFPDACRLKNGDIIAVFYAGYTHVSFPNDEFPLGGRICMVRSSDEGRTWTEAAVVYDDKDDNRDPHISQLDDGTLICTFFSLARKNGGDGMQGRGVQVVTSHDNGKTWDAQARVLFPEWYCSAPVRQLPDGTCLLGIYREDPNEPKGLSMGGTARSTDRGQTWEPPVPIRAPGVSLDAETDTIRLTDGRLYAALRSRINDMFFSISSDDGRTWSEAKKAGFPAHAPHFTRLSSGEIILAHRLPNTSIHISRDETRTWQGPCEIDSCIGAYPATVELKDHSVLIIYYTEGGGSVIRARRFKLASSGIEFLPWP